MKEKKKDSIVVKIVKVVTTLLLIIAIVLAFIGVYQKLTGKIIIPYQTVWVLTNSMEDEIPARSYILIKKVDASDVSVNDVITFYSSDPTLSGQLNTHRVIEIIGDNEEFITKGDHNSVQDNYTVKASNVVGKYVCNLKLFTLFGRFFATKAGLILVLLLICLALFIINFSTRKKNDKETIEQAKEEEMKKRIEEEVKRLEEEFKQNQE